MTVKNETECQYKVLFEDEDYWTLLRVLRFAEEMTIAWKDMPEDITSNWKQDDETIMEIRQFAIRIQNGLDDGNNYLI